MIKALKVTMSVYAVIGILFGLTMILIPEQMGKWFNAPALSDYEKFLTASIGVANIAAAVFIIMAARNPMSNISWVKFAIVWALFWVVTILYALARGYIDFSQEGVALIIHIVFAILFLVFYPWRAKESNA
jgi:hypothetical protein